ncbi:uncharacterized protein LOC123195651 [Mangifera indica]|uniref:uncharacterized protein LOC123195651 n=1 Tax=Mangifera indica TaxID=29780 RepID=UPI001CFAC53D|nr:uncharacterized protein LOC123195651 [Mangifera indica]
MYRESRQSDSNPSSIKKKIPPFQGRNDLEAYLDWERKVDQVFDIHRYSKEKKVKLVVVEFTDYASIWWDQLLKSRRRSLGRPIDTWDDMKSVMRQHFVPSHYHRDLLKKLQGLRQGTKSVEDYHKEMKIAMITANIEVDRETIMARFLNGMNREITNVVELQHYVELEDLVHMAMKVERQLQRKDKKDVVSYSSLGKPSVSKKDDMPPFKPKTEHSKPKGEESSREMSSIKPEPSKRNSEIKCFRCLGRGQIASQCPNKRTMVLREDGEYETEEESSDESMPPIEDASDVELEYALEGEALVSKRALSLHYKKENDEQRENIFHTRCHVKGRPWQYDKKVTYDGFKNRYFFMMSHKLITLVPLSPKQVFEDQEFEDVFPKEISDGLPPICGIEHQINFIPGAVIPNRPAYRSNPKETKELRMQVKELMKKGYVRESMNPCVVPVILVPKNDGT